MDQGALRYLLAAAALLVLNGQLAAHPHAWVDQQAILSLERGSAVIEYRVVPSFRDGTHMFDHLDANQDGIMSDREKQAYAAALLRSTRIVADGKRVSLRLVSVSIPPRPTMSRGAGLMAVKASAPLQLSPSRPHDITLNIDYALFKKGWFIQPFYGRSLTRNALPTLRRSPTSLAIGIEIQRAGRRKKVGPGSRPG